MINDGTYLVLRPGRFILKQHVLLGDNPREE